MANNNTANSRFHYQAIDELVFQNQKYVNDLSEVHTIASGSIDQVRELDDRVESFVENIDKELAEARKDFRVRMKSLRQLVYITIASSIIAILIGIVSIIIQ